MIGTENSTNSREAQNAEQHEVQGSAKCSEVRRVAKHAEWHVKQRSTKSNEARSDAGAQQSRIAVGRRRASLPGPEDKRVWCETCVCTWRGREGEEEEEEERKKERKRERETERERERERERGVPGAAAPTCLASFGPGTGTETGYGHPTVGNSVGSYALPVPGTTAGVTRV